MTNGRRLIALSVLCVCAAVLLVSVEATIATVFQWIWTPPDYASDGQQLTKHVLTTYDNTYMVTQCARRCLTSTNCASYNFLRAMNRCEINEESHLTSPQDLTFSDDAQYYLRDAYTIDKVALGPCADHPCVNGGTCLTSSVPNGGVLSFYCFCADGWTGSTCSAKADVISWFDWSAWSSCSSSCGDGFQVRGRNCVDVNTGAKRSPQACYGRDQEEQHCWIQQCPYWSLWSDWSSCVTATGCGAGKQVRGRTCTNGGTAGVDRLCLGPINETTPCQVTACDAPVRLQEGSTYGEGRVDVYDDVTSTWLPVCADDAWTKQDADVVCAQLGLRSGAYQVVKYPMQDGVAAAQYVIIGFSCSGSESRLASCHLQNWYGISCPSGPYAGVQCIVDGRWSTWSEWGSCSVTCASGISTRTRQCNSPPSLRGGKDCIENGTQSQPCTQPPCPVDAHWDVWQEWNDCSKSCGNGSQSRTRDCILGKFGGTNCTGDNLENQSCNTQPCPVDGVYSDWSAWSSCSVTCGSGSQRRNRTCQSPLFGGSACIGDADQTQTCLDRNCPVDGVYSDWSAWSSCSVTCGSGSQRRNRTCQSPLFGGSACIGDADQTQTCLDRNCPVDGVWSEWSNWSQCNVSCGGGGSSRTRNCTQPQFGGTACNGSSTEVQSCNTKSCAVDGAWNMWGSWSSCNATCGSGTKIRLRECNGPFYGGQPCPGSSQDQNFCNDDPCPVDGEWSAWSRWADCSVSCSVGFQTSYRRCSSVQNGGKLCPGNANRSQSCDSGPCPVDCMWMGWSPWSLCNVTCGGGLSWRSRSSNPELYGGVPCNGSANDSLICNTNPCPIPGEWVAWSSWSMCSVTCGLGGQRTRARTCNMTTYGSLTLPCLPLGGENDVIKCNNFSCFPVGKDCKEYYGRGLEDNVTFVTIDPDQDAGMNAPFQVLCQRDDTGVISVTIRLLREFKVQYVDRYGSNITIDQLITMVDDPSTSSCRQYISWKCYTAPMNSYSSTMTVTRLVYWKNRYYDAMGYWGDTTTTDYVVRANSGMTCSCGEKKSCGKTDLKCSCDLSDAVWRSDSGYLTQATHLPVTSYCVTDTGNATYKGSFEVGPLICYS